MKTGKSVSDPLDIYDIAQPEPSALVESLRAFGYSLRTAIADLVDNSISANARNIWIRFDWQGPDSFILIKDDGIGMTEAELVSAMRPGSKSPLEERPQKDLGRFGLGLKTASFSQCRRLSVVSKRNSSSLVTRCWDLDYINNSGEWRLLKKLDDDPLKKSQETIDTAGTIVFWEKMDRIVGNTKADDNAAYKRFLEAIDKVKKHLSMVFHRFLDKPSQLKMWINGSPIEAWDPFLTSEKATQELPSEKLFCNGHQLIVTPYVLPHKSKISDKTHASGSGPSGWNAQQGFYVYRNERLLVSGDWLGLGFQKEEHYKLARIMVDLPNAMDSAWQIDVKKSRAKPPGDLRNDLKRIAKLTREKAVQIYRHRGKVISRKSARDDVFLWEQKAKQGKYFYSINRQHPVIIGAYNIIGKENLEPVLKMIEATIPVAHITYTSVEEPEKIANSFDTKPYEEVRPIIETLYLSFLNDGKSPDEAFEILASVEPFNNRPELIDIFKEEKRK
jgi:hypothetical protein